MAGRKHHYIPQLLLRGFATPKGQCHVYRRDADYPSNIKDVYAQKDFYGLTEDEADGVITSLEGGFAKAVNNVREHRSIVDSDLVTITDFMAHLEVRTRNIRELVTNVVQQVEKRLHSSLSRQHGARSVLANALGSERVERSHVSSFIRQLPKFWNSFAPNIGPMLRKGHISALGDTPVPKRRAEFLRSMHARLIEVPDSEMILGDSGVFFETTKTNTFRPMLRDMDIFISMCLPISHNLVIQVVDDENRPPPTSDWLRKGAASTSSEAFVGLGPTGENAKLAKGIGQLYVLATNAEIAEMVADILSSDLTEYLPH